MRYITHHGFGESISEYLCQKLALSLEKDSTQTTQDDLHVAHMDEIDSGL